MRSIFLTIGEVIPQIIERKENLVIQCVQQGKEKKIAVIVSQDYSLSVDEQNRVLKKDPLMCRYEPKQWNENVTVFSMYYPFECRGLEKAAKDLAQFINTNLQEFQEVFLIGHSKSGLCFKRTMNWIKREVILGTISAPSKGTKVAQRDEFTRDLYRVEVDVYEMIFGEHCVDLDLIPDSEFLHKVNETPLKGNKHINIVSVCGKSVHPLELLLKYVDKRGKIGGDGVVPKESQMLQEKEGLVQIEIKASHAASFEKGIKEIGKMYPYLLSHK